MGFLTAPNSKNLNLHEFLLIRKLEVLVKFTENLKPTVTFFLPAILQ